MKVRHTLICFFFLSLQDGNRDLVDAQIIVYTRREGENVTLQCPSSLSRSRTVLCQDPCQKKDVLIETTDVRAQRGRYSIEWRRTSTIRGNFIVNITQLTKSDARLYRCITKENLNQWIEIIVIDALLEGKPSEENTFHATAGGNIVVACSFTHIESRKYFCRDECKEDDILVLTSGVKVQKGRYSIEYIEGHLYVSISQLTESDSGAYRCGRDRRVYREFRVIVADDPTTSNPDPTQAFSTSWTSQSDQQDSRTAATDTWLYVGLPLAVLVILLSLALLIYRRKMWSKAKGSPVEPEYAFVTETNRVYEDIKEDRRGGSAEISSTDVYATYANPDRAKTHGDYTSQNMAEDNLNGLTYSELNFSNRTVSAPNSAIRGSDDNVVYSVPQVKARSNADGSQDGPPVYSAVT